MVHRVCHRHSCRHILHSLHMVRLHTYGKTYSLSHKTRAEALYDLGADIALTVAETVDYARSSLDATCHFLKHLTQRNDAQSQPGCAISPATRGSKQAMQSGLGSAAGSTHLGSRLSRFGKRTA